jgi:hypothetical protein
MHFQAKAALLAAALTLAGSSAWAQTVVQSNAINIAAVVSIGGAPASVTQTGKYNYAGVVQYGVNPTASVAQSGTAVNSAFIAQAGKSATGSIVQGGGPRVTNAASVGQFLIPSAHSLRRR